MFCGGDKSIGTMDREHFVPRCLWSGRRPDKTLVMPAHVACNRTYSEDNEYFRDVLVAQEGVQRHPEARCLQLGQLRRKMEKRTGAFWKSFRNLGLRRLKTASGLLLGRHPVFDVDWPRIETVLKNVVKGVFYKLKGRPVPCECPVQVCRAEAAATQPFFHSLVGMMVPWQGFGDDVFACRYVTDDRHDDALACLLMFYRFSIFFGMTMPASLRTTPGEEAVVT